MKTKSIFTPESNRDLYFILLAVAGNLLLTILLISEIYFKKFYYKQIMMSCIFIWLNFIITKNYFSWRYNK